MTHIIEKIRERRRKDDSIPYYSFEFFPPKTEAGLENLLTRIDRMVTRLDPLFIDITFAAHSYHRTLSIASFAQRYLGVEVLLHITCQGMSQNDVRQVLKQAQGSGIHNLLVLRGDPPFGQDKWREDQVVEGDFPRAIDLVRWIRREFGSVFGIAVAGHPEAHPSSTSAAEELQHLKEKIEAGADFILTQLFYDVEVFLDFVHRCRAVGIDCPILPGIMPIQSYSSFARMTSYCGITVPESLLERVQAVKNDDETVREIGCQVATEMCQRILKQRKSLGLDGLHFYTLNLERSVTRVLMNLGVVDLILLPRLEQANDKVDNEQSNAEATAVSTTTARVATNATSPLQLADAMFRATAGRQLPWRPSAMGKRSHTEQIRPINWANRPKSYVMRTEDWDEFPNGRWGDATSPAFGELSDLSHFYSFSLGSEDDQRAMLGHNPRKPGDVYEVFALYVEGRIPHIPWCETPLQAESFLIQNQLAMLNRSGFLTINSQPAVNGVSSTHKTFGWGGPNGYVYQKAYCECFCSPQHASRLVQMVKKHSNMNLYAVNNSGEEIREGIELGGITALTWGVFPNREILQPTIFDPSTYLVWAEEAFSLWTNMWLRLYDFESESYELIENIRDTYYLCAIIDNDYITNNTSNSTNGSSLWKAMLDS